MSTVSNTVEVDELKAEVQRLKVENKFLRKDASDTSKTRLLFLDLDLLPKPTRTRTPNHDLGHRRLFFCIFAYLHEEVVFTSIVSRLGARPVISRLSWPGGPWDGGARRKELELQKNQAFRILHEATAEVEQRYEEAEAARLAAEEEVQQLRGRAAKLRRRVQCMFGQEDAMAAEPLTMLERLAAWSEYALPRLRHAITEARVAAARSEAAAAARSLACVVCLEAARDTYLNCGHIICRVCADQVDRCPICRAPITSRSKAFV